MSKWVMMWKELVTYQNEFFHHSGSENYEMYEEISL
jgi:hypothetical protein